MIGMVEAEVERAGKTSLARRYYLCSAPLSAKAFAHAVRAHWGIENRLHWVMDVVFHDDLMRLRTGHGPANMATIRHAALNLISSALWFSLRNEPSSDSPGLDGLGDGLPSVDLAHGDLPEASRAQSSMGTVSAQGSTVWVLMRRRNSSFSRSMALVVRADFHCDGSRRVKANSRSPASSRLSATADT